MGYDQIYGECRKLLNQSVEIRCHDGSVHRGILTHVDDRHAYLQMQGGNSDFDHPGLFVWGWGRGFPIALASIAAIVALGFFFW
ncbi:hypothetical protein [Sporolactobacillus vineae]|uniref:hypothetical protein n=1 Tax=Sporolactobacillus vineae TaxID=444463 RepID=UPI000287F89E|nr:hypothetical protein [Sporolactobacillus vineae]